MLSVSGVGAMRGLLQIAAILSLAAGCATAPPASDHADSGAAPFRDETQRPAHPGKIAALCANDAMLRPILAAGIFGDCQETRDALAKADAEIAALKASIGARKTDFAHVTLAWTKAALYNLGYYKECEKPSSRNCVRPDESNRDTIVEDSTYDAATIDAVKRFQISAYQLDNGNDPRVSGWITYPEACFLICRAGRKQEDAAAILAAAWLARGDVFAMNLERAYWIIDGFIAQARGIANRQPTPERKAYFNALKLEAIQLREFIVSQYAAQKGGMTLSSSSRNHKRHWKMAR